MLLLFFAAAPGIRAQKMAEDYFFEANYKKDVLENESAALIDYLYLVEHYPDSKYCIEAFYEMGGIYDSMKQNQLAINAYRGTVFNKYRGQLNKDTTFSEFDVKPIAIERLAGLYEKIGVYDSALYFRYLYDTAIRVFYSCGTGLELRFTNNTVTRANLHLKANQVKEAEKILLSAFTWRNYDDRYIEEYDGYSGVRATLQELFTKHKNADTLKARIETAVNNYYFDTTYLLIDGMIDTSVYCVLNFLDTKVGFLYYCNMNVSGSFVIDVRNPGLPDRKKIITILKRSELYHMIQKL